MVFAMFKLKVNRKLQDKYTGEVYLPGSAFVTDDASRVNDLVRRGVCDFVGVEAAPATGSGTKAEVVSFQGVDYALEDMKNAFKAAGLNVAANAGVKGVTNAIEKLSEEEAAKLSESLKKEE